MKSKNYCTWKVILDQCKQCRHYWSFEGWDDSKQYRDLISGKTSRLCKRCITAKATGEYRYQCEGCAAQVTGSFEDVRDLLNVFGKAFCKACMTAFYGRYDRQNPALIAVLAGMAEAKKAKRRAKYLDSEALQRLYEEELRYGATVRRLSRANLRRFPEVLNPQGHKLGRSGEADAHQLDHIVPVSLCWAYRVAEESASSMRNLQVVPWFVNTSRGDGMLLEWMVGWPYPVKKKRTSFRY